MHWKELESLIHDNYSSLANKKVDEISKQLLGDLTNADNPLQAAKTAYVLALLQLKAEKPSEIKCIQFIVYMQTIVEHEIKETKVSRQKNAPAHLQYIYKLVDQYLHHLITIADIKNCNDSLYKLTTLRKKFHRQMFKLKKADKTYWQLEQRKIKNFLRRHIWFSNFVLVASLYFAWTSFWSLSDYLLNHWIYSQYTLESVFDIASKSLLLVFAASVLWAFLKYQKVDNALDKQED